MTSVKPLLLAYSPRLANGLSLGRSEADIDAYMVRALPSSETLNLVRPTVVLLDRQLVAGVHDLTEQLRALSRVVALVWCASEDEDGPPARVPAALLTNVIPYEAPITLAVALLREAMRHAVALRNLRQPDSDAELSFERDDPDDDESCTVASGEMHGRA